MFFFSFVFFFFTSKFRKSKRNQVFNNNKGKNEVTFDVIL